MNSITIKDITLKLENAPQSVLDRVLEYVDALLESSKNKEFVLTDEQKQILLSQNEIPLDQCKEAEEVYLNLKEKYDP